MSLTADQLIQIRRHLHQIPELALHETKTHAYLKEVIAGLPQTYLTVHEDSRLPTALLVRVAGSRPQRTIGYRTDIDALPVSEPADHAVRSHHPGVMHACGHDIHMSVALGILSYFADHQPVDNLVFFFQPAEESESGGKQAYDLGLLTGEYQVDEFYGLHDNPDLPTGTIGCRNGTLFAGTTEVNLTVHGKSGHAAFPHEATDAVVIAAALILQLQTIISRDIDPTRCGVITFGKVTAGTIRNVIAGEARLEGTIRGLTQEMLLRIRQRVQEVANGVAASYNATIDVDFNQGGYYPVENNPELTQRFIDYMQHAPQVAFQETRPAMTGEDFGYLLAQIPGTMFWLGVDSPGALHAANFVPHEAAIMAGVTAMTGFLEYRMQA
ncbi:N-acetyldiaminopimelate deacetylase [Levilactobacillus zymae]|uniref:N-acetyldiaminopimelate deacetylase n=1 Tax=Levilactobacillus zymae TaxID=267363 RepID=A0A1Y6JUG7_9LACO|nr:N-acetyldiaminopimelate deacetylase [Levilactobacillus zymae]KRL15105.1 M20 M25 M40 family peptidase [Levilactobacillus zymae DSM 19395]QFR61394.1 amidohydrolase [Levilactobacillus zymae]GEO71728.1 N-acetyldiaminopimelate deacetylase [Levilactobacillus zymae]SMS13589.1 N-acetyl-L,L-diaminopimelate deacetylase [Levilactobacillus zymae]